VGDRNRVMNSSAIVVVGGASTDFVAYGPCLPKAGEELTGEKFRELPGGKGGNQAVAAARLGGNVALIARVGADQRGTALIEHLQREGVDTQFCLRDPHAPTGGILLMVDHDGTKQTLTIPGATARLNEDDVGRATGLLEHAHVLLVQCEAPVATVVSAIALAHRLGRRVLLDAAPVVSLPQAVWKQIYLVRADAKEASALTGVEVADVRSARRATRVFLERGVEVVAVQAGFEGNVLTWPEGELVFPPIPVKAIDRTGAGDAFIAALAVALVERRPWSDAGWFANAAAALTTTRLGAEPGLPRRQEVLSLLSEIGK
jgi:ribokinase